MFPRSFSSPLPFPGEERVVHAGVKSGGKPGGRERKRERGKQRGKDLEGRRNSDGLLDSFHSPSISRVTFMTAERAAFEGIRITKERTMATRGGGRIKPAPPL